MRLVVKISVLTAVLCLATTAFAQVNVMGEPSYGTFNINAGFTPDPQTIPVVAGGTISTSTLPNCLAGNISATPDVRVNYTAGTFPLRFYVDAPGHDTTLAINGPNGQWYCNDDTVGLNPVIDFQTPISGQYDIFVGTYASGQYPNVNLYVTELPGSYGPGVAVPSQPTQPTQPIGQVAAGGINLMGEPGFGTFTINNGFTPDPQSMPVTAGGQFQSNQLMTGAGMPCNAGFISNVPDVRVHYNAGSWPLRFYVSTPGTDTTLAVNSPDGQWHCNDDTVGLHPVIDFPTPHSGQYDVFVGTYSQGQYPQVTLYLTEMPASVGPTP